ncbi:hypothetical protein [Marinoscillum sp.]|uniref:hypothetical protein n=1 Tax=Marinoscillum sp. TaxID=2024838 RepID=UPI003BA857B2
MKLASVIVLLSISIPLFAESWSRSDADKSEPYLIERKILTLSAQVHVELIALYEYQNLKTFCNDDSYKESIFDMLDEIHEYHDLLEEDLRLTTYRHSQRTIRRLLKHMDRLDEKHNPDKFSRFFETQCSFQVKIESNARHYSAAFSSHSYSSRVYAQEVVMYRYLRRLTRRVQKIRKHVEHFYTKKRIWEQDKFH